MDAAPLENLARGSCEIPQPPEAPKKAKKGKKHKKAFEAEVDELDERQKHDIGLLLKEPPAARPKRAAKRRDEPMPLDPVVREVLESLRSDPAWSSVNGAESLVEFASSLEQMHQLQEVIKFLAPQARQLDSAHQRAKELDQALSEARAQLEKDAAAKMEMDKQRAEAVQRLEELELKQIETNGQLLKLQKDKSPHGANGTATKNDGKAMDMERLEKLLKDAILHGAKLGRAKKELEEEVAHHKAEQGRLQRKMSQLTQEAGEHQQLRARYKQRMERMESKLLRQRDRLEDLEADLEDAESRADRVEERLAEYMRQCTSGGVDGVLEAHLQHVASAGRKLQAKVEEQEEIIEVLRQLLQNHKDFIRNELGAELDMPAGMEGDDFPTEKMLTTKI